MLAARAGRAVDLHLNVLRTDLDVLGIVRDLRNDLDRGERGLPPRVRVKRRNTHQTVHAVLALEEAVGVLALDEDAGGFDPGLVAVEVVQNFIGQAVRLDPAGIHAIKHLRPVLRFRAARTGLKGHDGVVAVVFALEQRLQPRLLHILFQRVVAVLQLVEHGVVVLLERHLADGHQVVPCGGHVCVFVALAFERLRAHHGLLRARGVVPEARRLCHCVQTLQLVEHALRQESRLQLDQPGLQLVQFCFIFFKFDHSRFSIKDFSCISITEHWQ